MDLPFRYVRFGCAMNIESGLSVREVRSLYTTLSLRCCPFVIRIVSTIQVHMSIVARLMPCEKVQVDSANKAR